MSTVTSRELAGDVAGVLRRMEQGEDVIVTVNGRPVAKLIPLPDNRRRALPPAECRAARQDPSGTL